MNEINTFLHAYPILKIPFFLVFMTIVFGLAGFAELLGEKWAQHNIRKKNGRN